MGITITHEPLPAAGVVILKYKADAETAWTQILNNNQKTSTITIASPAVVSSTAHGFVDGDAIQFSTTGALPTGITAGTIYYVISTGLTADAFQFSATSGGSAVNTSGSQSGTHYAIKTSNVISHDAVNIESSGANLPQYKEIQFQIQPSCGAVVTGLEFREEIIDRKMY